MPINLIHSSDEFKKNLARFFSHSSNITRTSAKVLKDHEQCSVKDAKRLTYVRMDQASRRVLGDQMLQMKIAAK